MKYLNRKTPKLAILRVEIPNHWNSFLTFHNLMIFFDSEYNEKNKKMDLQLIDIFFVIRSGSLQGNEASK